MRPPERANRRARLGCGLLKNRERRGGVAPAARSRMFPEARARLVLASGAMTSALSIAREATPLLQELRSAVERALEGKPEAVELALIALLARGHVLIEDVPGVGKTTLARALAKAVGGELRRVQFTSDLLPSDVLGVSVFDQRAGQFQFRQGPIFANILLADEINRATPKTQAALLEAMQEAQVTIEGERFPLERPFLVIATQNPIDLEGTYPLPEAQLDRFLVCLAVGYPGPDEEREILARRRRRREDAARIPTVISRAELLDMQAALEDVFVSEAIERYIVDLVQATRADSRVALGASPRGALALLKLARGSAALRRRDFVTPDDVKAMAIPVLAHRLIVRPELWVSKVTSVQVVADLLATVPTPRTETQ